MGLGDSENIIATKGYDYCADITMEEWHHPSNMCIIMWFINMYLVIITNVYLFKYCLKYVVIYCMHKIIDM